MVNVEKFLGIGEWDGRGWDEEEIIMDSRLLVPIQCLL
jgi:hypothetical protein